MPNTASPYIPSFLRSALEDNKPVQLTFSEVKHTNIQSTSSFLYDPTNAPLKNTQQLNIDWSKFENHTFFSSAEAKVNLAFDQVINGYPFDGSRAEIEAFFERLTGFDRWVFDQFPKFKGQLMFSGTQYGEDVDGTLGSWIKLNDFAGALYPEISKKKSGEGVINPKDGVSFTLELNVFLPPKTNSVSTIFQKLSGSQQGLSLYLEKSISTGSCVARFAVVSGSSYVTAAATLRKGCFNHVCVTLNRESTTDFVDFYVDEVLQERSRMSSNIGELDIDASDVLIGTGTMISLGATDVIPKTTFSGSLDELRVFHSARTVNQQELYAKKAIYATPDLKLYYRFNEPPPPLTPDPNDPVNAIVLDSSGNSLHALITNFEPTLRHDASQDPASLMIYEKPETYPVLFPAYPTTVNLNTQLLASASEYDKHNPNLITRLVPQHYLLEGDAQDGTVDWTEPLAPYGGTGMPGQSKASSQQIVLSFLYIWARFFDEMKLYLDSFSALRYLDYTGHDNSPNNFLYDFVRAYGFHLPPLFGGATIDQYVNAENVGYEIATSAFPLKVVQNELLRRVLINMPQVVRSKGTQHAIKSFLRAMGIDPENSLRIREYGGPTERPLSFSRERKFDSGAMVQFVTSSLATSPFLSASRVEVGFPKPAGSMVQQDLYPPHGISQNQNDGLLTSGSWTVEGIFKFTPQNIALMTSATQSLARLAVGDAPGTSGSFVANLLAISSSFDPKVLLYVRPGNASTSPLLRMEIDLPPGGIFNYDRWNISFGRYRNDEVKSNVSSSYFLRVATQNDGDVTWFASTSSFFLENPAGEANVWQAITLEAPSGSYLAIGENQASVSSSLFLADILAVPEEARTTAFTGRASNLRFWSKAVSDAEFREHTRNYKSLGVENPLVNYNFNQTSTGSWNRVRIDALQKQVDRAAVTSSMGISGSITFIDFSLNGLHLTGSGFPPGVNSVVGEIFDHSYLSPYFDEAATDEKIRVRGYQNQDLVDATPWASVAPVHEIVRSERPTDDTRLSIEFSLVDALNRDIVTLFSTFDALDNALGAPELVYSPDYPNLDHLRNVYFNRITRRLNFQDFFEFFRWFDKTLGTFIEQLIPRKTRFKGTNFTIESHMLERAKLEHLSSEIYLGEEDRSRIRDVLLVQQVTGIIRKY
jgi:hypothetical protein